MNTAVMNEQLKNGKHRAIEAKVQLLCDVITTKSTPAVFGGHLVENGFMNIRFLNEVLGMKGDGPSDTVLRLLTAVVTTIKTVSTPEGSAEYFDRFVAIIGAELQLPDIAQQVLEKCAELEKLVTHRPKDPSQSDAVEKEHPRGQPTSQPTKQPCQYLTKDQARKKRKHLRSFFTSLVIQTKEHLESTKKEKKEFVVFRDEFILQLPTLVKQEHMKFFHDEGDEIRGAKSIDELFYCLNLYWDYLNYNLLESIIIEQLKIEKLQEGMGKYSADVNEFRETIQLEVFCKIEPSMQIKPPADFKEIAVEHSITKLSTLQAVENIRVTVTKRFGLPNFALMLGRIVLGSVIVTWVMPRSVVGLLLCGLTAELMDELHIVSMKIVEDARSIKGKTLSVVAPQKPEIANAAATGNTARVEELVGKGNEKLNETEQNGMTPLMYAAANGHTDTVDSVMT